MNCEKNGYIIPCIYALMSNKLQSTYGEQLKKLKEIEPELDPSSIMIRDGNSQAVNNAVNSQWLLRRLARTNFLTKFVNLYASLCKANSVKTYTR